MSQKQKTVYLLNPLTLEGGFWVWIFTPKNRRAEVKLLIPFRNDGLYSLNY